MTIRFSLTLAVEGAATAGGATTRVIGAALERDELTAEVLGLTLAEGKAILAELQAVVVAEQVAAHEAAARRCTACGADRGIKGHHPLTCRTTFGTLPLTAMRLRRCRCGADRAAGDRASFSPLADLLPGRTIAQRSVCRAAGRKAAGGAGAALPGDALGCPGLLRPGRPHAGRRAADGQAGFARTGASAPARRRRRRGSLDGRRAARGGLGLVGLPARS